MQESCGFDKCDVQPSLVLAMGRHTHGRKNKLRLIQLSVFKWYDRMDKPMLTGHALGGEIFGSTRRDRRRAGQYAEFPLFGSNHSRREDA